jgi:hypothetical protein
MNETTYNNQIKQQYLNQFENQDTREVYSRLFKKASETEDKFNKDLYNFNDEEVEYFLANVLHPKTKESARTYCNVLANYIQWAIDNPKITNCKNLTNPMKRRQEFFYEFVQESRPYFNMEEKQAMLSTLMNNQDGFIIEGLWEGIQGTKLSELVNLRIDDMNSVDGTIVLRDNEGNITRQIVFDVKHKEHTDIFKMAILANKEFEYYKINGKCDYSDKVRQSVYLPVRSEYVLKSAPTNSKDNDQGGEKVSHYTVYNRLEMLRKLDEFEGYTDALTTKNIVRSGMIHMALILYERDGELGRKQIEEICTKYDMKYKWSLRDFLNLDMLKSLYPSEMQIIESKTDMT